MDGSFASARPVAQHCAELTKRGPRPEERAEHLAAWSRDVGHELARNLGALFPGGKLRAAMSEPQTTTGAQVFETIGPVAINSLLRCGDGDQTMLLSLDFATAIAMTDCSFGGEGLAPEQAPAQLPRSVSLLVEQVADAIANVLGAINGADSSQGDVLVRSESVTRLKPFEAGAQIACFTLVLSVEPVAEWSMLLAVESDRLDELLPGLATPRVADSKRGRCTGDAGPFAELPLPLEAVLGEIDLSVTRLNALRPGDEFPFAIPPELPLRAGNEVLAHGTLGTRDNRMAVCLTRFARHPTACDNQTTERHPG